MIVSRSSLASHDLKLALDLDIWLVPTKDPSVANCVEQLFEAKVTLKSRA